MQAYACAFKLGIGGLAVAALLTSAAAREPVSPPTIVCTTTHLSGMVEALAGGLFQTETMIPWGMCPGHFELKRGDIEKIRGAALILTHGYEKFLAAFEGHNAIAPIAVASVPGHWMIPAVQKKAAERVAALLAETFPQHAATITANAMVYRKRIDRVESELQPCLQRIKNKPVVCSTMNADYILWMGCAVTAEFQRDEDLSVQNLQDAIKKGRKAQALLIIDNRQSSGKVGQTLARQLNLPLIMLDNFPEPDAGGQCSYEATLKKDILALDAQIAGAPAKQ